MEDLTGPFVRMASGIRHIQALPDTMEESEVGDCPCRQRPSILPAASANMPSSYGTRLHTSCPPWQLRVWWSLLRGGLGLKFVLNVQVNGENVGYVGASRCLRAPARMCESRINTAKRMLQNSGSDITDTNWDVYPTYSLSIGNQTMTESEIANAILRTAQ